jgi:hypothetical protein
MEGSDTLISIPQADSGWARYLMGLFVLAWLGGWCAGLVSVLSTLAAGKGNAFMAFWLIAWTVGGIFALAFVYRLLRPSVPESLRLQSNAVIYDSGIAPIQVSSFDQSRRETWKSMFPKRTRVELDRRKLQTLRLRETAAGNRLTVDADSERIDVARSASEIEREWLYQVLAKRYALPVSAAERALKP